MTFITIPGYFNEPSARKLVMLLTDKTFYKFKVSYGYDGSKHNCVVNVGSDYVDEYGKEISKSTLRDAFFHYALLMLSIR